MLLTNIQVISTSSKNSQFDLTRQPARRGRETQHCLFWNIINGLEIAPSLEEKGLKTSIELRIGTIDPKTQK